MGLGSNGFETIHGRFQGGNVRFKRGDSLVELRRQQPHQCSRFLKFVPELLTGSVQFMPDCRVSFSDLSDVAPEGLSKDAEMTFDLFHLFSIQRPCV